MVVNIRKITPRYYVRCIEVQKTDGYRHSYYLTIDRIRTLAHNGEQFFGAFTETGSLVGFVSVNVDVVRMRIHFFSVMHQYQRKGVGSNLLLHILDAARMAQVSNIYTYTEPESALELFLLHKGFVQAGYFKRRFGDKDANILSMYL